jgi:hypothetical protein
MPLPFRRRDPPMRGRHIRFRLYRGDIILVEDRFTVLRCWCVCSFGHHREFAVAGLEGPAVIFEGAIIEHELLKDGAASIGLKYYSMEPDADSPIGVRQTIEVNAGLSIGSESGAEKQESVMLADTHEFVFRTWRIA